MVGISGFRQVLDGGESAAVALMAAMAILGPTAARAQRQDSLPVAPAVADSARDEKAPRPGEGYVAVVSGGQVSAGQERQPTAHYPELGYAPGEAPPSLRSTVPLFLDAGARLLDDDESLTLEEQAQRVLREVYGCTPALCPLDFTAQADSYEELVRGIARGIALERVFSAPSEQELAIQLGPAVAGWGTAEKLALIQHVGRRLRHNYDYGEALEGPRRKLGALDLVRGR
jgi:hypothetical protein